MSYHKPNEDTEVRDLKVEWVSEVKKNKKGGDYISVKSGKDTFWYVGDEKLFDHFIKGQTVKCLVRDGDFKSIVDVVNEDFVEARAKLPAEKTKEPLFSLTKHDWELLDAKVDKIGKLVAEIHDKIYQSEEAPDLNKTEFPPKKR